MGTGRGAWGRGVGSNMGKGMYGDAGREYEGGGSMVILLVGASVKNEAVQVVKDWSSTA